MFSSTTDDLNRFPEQAQGLLGSRFIRLVSEITIYARDKHLTELILESVSAETSTTLKKLDIIGLDLANIDLGLLTNVVLKLQDCEIRGHGSRVGYPQVRWNLTASQLSALFTIIRQSPDLRLRQFVLPNMDLTLIPLEDLAGAIQRLEVAQFRQGWMTVEQLTTILTLAKEERLGRIRRIRIQYVGGMRSVSSALIQEARLSNKLQWGTDCY